MNFKWYFNRFKLMSNKERFYRLQEIFSKFLLNRFRVYNWEKLPKINLNEELLSKLNYNSNVLKSLSIIENKSLKIFTLELDPLQIKDWRRDYKNGITSPIKYYAFLKRQKFKEVGDIKYVTEVNRLYHFPIIASNIVTTGDKDLLKILKKQTKDWMEQNPFLYSINWTSGIEVAVRVINILYSYLILKYFDFIDNELEKNLSKLIWQSFNFLRHHLSLYSSANNHLTAELMGLIAICSIFNFKNSKVFLNKYLNMQLQELQRQIHDDGFTKEQATRYHAEVLDHFIISFHFAKLAGKEIPNWASQKLFRMAEILSYFINSSGYTQEVGDSDEGYVLYPYNDLQFNFYQSILNSVSFLLKRLFFSKLRLDFRNYLIFGENYRNFVKKIEKKPLKISITQRKIKIFKNSGYLFIIDKPFKIIFDVGPIGLEPLAAHGHADALSFILEFKDQPVIVDSGTFQYHSRYKNWRDYFRGTKAHNTISVCSKDQGVSGGRMMWLKKPDVKLIFFHKTTDEVKCTAEHDGFVRQKIPVLHRRTMKYDLHKKVIEIEDFLIPTGDVNAVFAEFYLHFSPSLKIELNNDKLLIFFNNLKDVILIENYLFKHGILVCGDDKKPFAWYSPSFDVKIPTTSLYLKFNLSEVQKLHTTITYLENA